MCSEYVLWGDKTRVFDISESFVQYMGQTFNIDFKKIRWDGYYHVPTVSENRELKTLLSKCLPDSLVSFNVTDRFYHSFGKSAYEYIQLMLDKPIKLVDAVIYPQEDMVSRVFEVLKDHATIIIYGGGTSVTGGLMFKSGALPYTISLDTKNFNTFHLYRNSRVLEVGAGLNGRFLEKQLKSQNLTIGNFPESFEFSTIGGWIATNAAGQESNHYGKLKDIVLGIKIIAPTGTYVDNIVPAESTFLRLSDLVVGSEGALGVITRAWLKVHNMPKKLWFKAYIFRSFFDGIEALRSIAVYERLPTIARLSDTTETTVSIYGLKDTIMTKLFKRYLSLNKMLYNGAILIIVDNKKINFKFKNAISLGSKPAKIWYNTRFDRPYVWNELLKRTLVIDTIETSALWKYVPQLYTRVTNAFNEVIHEEQVRGLIMCHASHEYLTGTALYFTFLFYAEKEHERILQRLRKVIISTIIQNGGALSHHHGIGSLVTEEFKQYKGKLYTIIKDVKKHFDPDNIINAGVLI